MNSTLNNQTMSKSMNGLNIGSFDELTTESFSATTLSSTNLSVSGALTLPANSILDSYLTNNVPLKDTANTFTEINTFTQPPVMSGASIENATIPVAAINGLSTGYMDLTTNQIVVSGTKTYNVAPVVPRLGMVSANSTFVGNNMNTTASEGTYVGFQAGRLQNNLASRNTAIGCNALDRLPQSNQNTAVGYQALYLFADGGSIANTALGAYSLATLRSGSRNIGVGTAAGNGLVNQCSNNVAFASDSISNSSNKTLFNYANISGANVPYASPFIFDPVRFDTTGGTIRARMYVRYYNGELNQAGSSRIESYDSATYTAVLQGTAGARIACIAGSVLRFTQGGGDISIDTNYTGAGGTGTTFTIATGLGTIPAGYIMVYSTTATMTKWATVSSYNSTTGVLILTTSITLVAGLINFFGSALDRGSYVNNCCAIGAGALQNFACGQTAPMNGNCAFGQNALNGAGGGYDNASYLAGNYNTSFGNNAGSWCTSTCSFNTFLGAETNILVPYSTINVSTAVGYGAKLDDSNLIVLGTAFETTRCWAMDVRGLPNFSSGLTVSAGTITLPATSIADIALSSNVPLKDVVNTFTAVQNFEANIRAISPSGDVFQAFKNSVVGNAGHVLINGDGNLLYYDTTASAIKWRLDTDGKLTVGSIDLSGTLINKNTAGGDFIRSNSNATGYFYASNNGEIGYSDSTSNMSGKRWFINAGGGARFVSSSNSFKYWELAGNLFRYYNLGGSYTISLNGDSGAITTPGSITTTNTISTANLNVSGTINSSGGTTTFGGDIDTGLYDIYTDVVVSNQVNTVLGIDIQDGNNGVIQFSGGAQKIRIGTTTSIDATPDGIVIGNGSTSLGACITIGNASFTTNATRGTGSVIVGNLCEALGNYSVNIGHNAISVQNGVCIGRQARAGSNVAHTEGIAIGKESLSGTQAVSIGANNQANAQDAISIGKTAYANGQGAVAIGAYSVSNGVKSIAIGYNASAGSYDNSVSIGESVACTTGNQFSLGNASHNILLCQCFYPFEINPTIYTTTPVTIAGAPAYGMNILSYAGVQYIILPPITSGLIGITLTFRKIAGIGSNTFITCSTGNQYLPFQSGTPAAAGTYTLFIGGSAATARATVFSAIQWAVTT